jgi:hypothetical protein
MLPLWEHNERTYDDYGNSSTTTIRPDGFGGYRSRTNDW